MKIRFGYAGAHIFDRATGLNVLMDEVDVPPSDWSVAPRYMSFALTNACELACSYCYASKAPAKLPSERVRRWAGALDAKGCFGIGFGGGEPTLYPGFATLCRDLHNDTRLAITMTTHGHRFSGTLVDQLAGNVDFIRLSMDGMDAIYEQSRGRPFTQFREKMALVRVTARFGINYVVNDDTIAELPRAADFVFDNGAEELLLLPQLTTDGKLSLRHDTLDRLSAWAREHHQRCRLATSSHGGHHIDAPMLMTADPRFESFDFMHVDAFGTLKFSAFQQRGRPLKVGDDIVKCIQEMRTDILAREKHQ
jgi:MoaA/NifB/PqqE/SkfB family radical SAM enzyme